MLVLESKISGNIWSARAERVNGECTPVRPDRCSLESLISDFAYLVSVQEKVHFQVLGGQHRLSSDTLSVIGLTLYQASETEAWTNTQAGAIWNVGVRRAHLNRFTAQCGWVSVHLISIKKQFTNTQWFRATSALLLFKKDLLVLETSEGTFVFLMRLHGVWSANVINK